MAFEKGKSGNPAGRPPDEKCFASALRIAVNRDAKDGRKKLLHIAEKLVDQALEGAGWAIQQVADRLDGKPAQESTVTIDDKRDAEDWSRDELVAFLRNARTDSARVAEAKGRGGKLN